MTEKILMMKRLWKPNWLIIAQGVAPSLAWRWFCVSKIFLLKHKDLWMQSFVEMDPIYSLHLLAAVKKKKEKLEYTNVVITLINFLLLMHAFYYGALNRLLNKKASNYKLRHLENCLFYDSFTWEKENSQEKFHFFIYSLFKR